MLVAFDGPDAWTSHELVTGLSGRRLSALPSRRPLRPAIRSGVLLLDQPGRVAFPPGATAATDPRAQSTLRPFGVGRQRLWDCDGIPGPEPREPGRRSNAEPDNGTHTAFLSKAITPI